MQMLTIQLTLKEPFSKVFVQSQISCEEKNKDHFSLTSLDALGQVLNHLWIYSRQVLV